MDIPTLRTFCLEELNRLAFANQLFERSLMRMHGAATAPLLRESLLEQLSTNARVGVALGQIHSFLEHPLMPLADPGARGLAISGELGMEHDNPNVRDIAIARTALRIDQWSIVGYEGLSSFLRQLVEDEAADCSDRVITMLGTADRHLDNLRSSLTGIAQDEQRHGHRTRRPEERNQRPMLMPTS